MKAEKIQQRSRYEISMGQTKTGEVKKAIVKVVDWNPKTKAWICETESGKEITVKDPKRFLKEVKEKTPPASATKSKSLPASAPAKKKASVPPLKVDPEEIDQIKASLNAAVKRTSAAKNAFEHGFIEQDVLDKAESELADIRERASAAGLIEKRGGRANGQMGGKAAALRVLQEEGRPMRAKELCDIAHERGYCTLTGNTPDATIAAAIATDIKVKGVKSAFKRVDAGLFAVNEDYKD